MRYLPIAILLLGAFSSPVRAQKVGTCAPAIGEAYLDVGNVRARILNNGNLFWRGSPHVYEVPKGGGASALFASGVWIGGLVGRQLRMAGSTYGPYEFWAGPLDDQGFPPSDCSVFDRVYKVGREDLVRYAQDGSLTPDLRDWPTGLGAPTLDAEGAPIDLMHLPLHERVDRVIDWTVGERPDMVGDQILWWVMNDRGNVHNRTDTAPVGLEVHVSAFAFNTAGAVGNTTFHRYRIFYKGEADLTKAYFGIFSDPDLGNFDDDYVGSDSVLGLAFTYNADNDDEGGQGYGAAPPATGYDFLQVPGVSNVPFTGAADKAQHFRKRMGAFAFYSGGSGVTGDMGNAADAYHYMQGEWKDGKAFTVGGNGRDFSTEPSNYHFSGVPPEFWSEFDSDRHGTSIAPADRRFLAASTPFEMRPWSETQVTFSITTSFGADNLDSVKMLKEDSFEIQAFFDSGFALPDPPAAPRITTNSRDGQAFFQWNYLRADNNYQDSYDVLNPALSGRVPDRHYRFEGYNVYQFDSASDSEGRLLAVYDLKNGVKRVLEGEVTRTEVAFGTDSGLQHHELVEGLTNYRTYHFGVQAYAYNPHSSPRVLKGPTARFEVVPTPSLSLASVDALGFLDEAMENMAAGSGSILATSNPENTGLSTLSVNVIDDAALTGLRYDIEFMRRDTSAQSVGGGGLTFRIERADGVTVVDRTIRGHSPFGVDVVRFDGLSLNVSTIPDRISSFETISNHAGRIDPPIGAAADWMGYPGPVAESTGQQSTTSASWLIVTGQSHLCPAADCSSYEAFLQRTIVERSGWGDIVPYDWEIRFTEQKSYAWEPWTTGGVIEVPFELWRTGISSGNDRSEDVRLIPMINDIDGNGQFNLLAADHPISPGADDPFTDWFYWHLPESLIPGDAGYRGWLSKALAGAEPELGPEVFGRMSFVNWNGASSNSAGAGIYNAYIPEPGTTFRIKTESSTRPGDRFRVLTDQLVVSDTESIRRHRIGITPNPYVGASDYEVSSLTDEVRFTNMPERATVRIYQLNGVLVKMLRKNSPERFLTWDLRTEHNLPIGSGLYLIYVESEAGSQVLKFGVVKKKVVVNTQ